MNELTIDANIKLAGFYRVQTRNIETGEWMQDTGWFQNLVTNTMFDILCGANGGLYYRMSWCGLGTSTTPPANTDTTLGNQYGSRTNWIDQDYGGNSGTPDYYIYRIRRFVFPQGTIIGNMTEVGIFTGQSDNSCISHSLLKDGSGNPTSVTVTPIEQLYITYEVRQYPDTSTSSGSIVLDGVTYAYTRNTAKIFADNGIPGVPGMSFSTDLTQGAAHASNVAYDRLDDPYMYEYQPSSIVVTTYVPGNYYSEAEFTWNPASGNISGGIGAISITSDQSHRSEVYNWYFTPKIAKDNTKQLKLKFRLTVGRI